MRKHREWLEGGGHLRQRRRFPRRTHQPKELMLLPLWAKATLLTIRKYGPQRRRARLHLTKKRVATLEALGLITELSNLVYLTLLGKTIAKKIPKKAGKEGKPQTHWDKSGQGPPQAIDLENPDASRYRREHRPGGLLPAVTAGRHRP